MALNTYIRKEKFSIYNLNHHLKLLKEEIKVSRGK